MDLEPFLKQHSGELLILILSMLLLGTLLILVPQLLRDHQRVLDARHAENLRSLEQGLPPPRLDERSVFAGRTALLVPMVSICTAGTVTCFLAVYRSDILLGVALAVWTVSGVVSLAAITGGVTLLARLAQLHTGQEEEEVAENPLEH